MNYIACNLHVTPSRETYQPQVSKVDIGDKEGEGIAKEIPRDTIFLRRRDKSTGPMSNAAEGSTYECRPACGSEETTVEGNVSSTVCDATCMNGHPWMGIRFEGHNCGAGDPLKYGESCRLCYNDQHAALDADRALTASNGMSWISHGHVIMCDTKRPPEAMTCSRECTKNLHTVGCLLRILSVIVNMEILTHHIQNNPQGM